MKAAITFIPHDQFKNDKNLSRQPIAAIYLLGEIMRAEGIDIRIIDPFTIRRTNSDYFEEIKRDILQDADVIFLSSNSYNWYNTKKVIDTIKSADEKIPVVLGGIHPTMMDIYVMETTKADVIIRGEGEKIVSRVAKAVVTNPEDLCEIEGITFRTSAGIIKKNKDSEPLREDEFEKYNAKCVFKELPADIYFGIPCETSRGCRFNCSFCGIAYHCSWKALNTETIYKKLMETAFCVRHKTNNGCITLTDDCITANRERFVNILNFFKEELNDIGIIMEGRLNEIASEEVLNAMKENRIRRFLVGIECGYDEGLKRIRKGYTTEQIEKYLKTVKEAGLGSIIYCSFIIFLPWETEDDCLKTIHFAAKLVEKYGVKSNISIWNIIPSELWDKRKEYSLEVEDSFFDTDLLQNADEYERYLVQIHPNITEKGYRKIKKVLSMYGARGIYLTNN